MILGDFGGDDGAEVVEFTLGSNNIGTKLTQQTIDTTIYVASDGIHVLIEMDMESENRQGYTFVEGGELCVLWAVGNDINVESSHSNTSRGMQCFDIDGTTGAPTPSPTYFPTVTITNDTEVNAGKNDSYSDSYNCFEFAMKPSK